MPICWENHTAYNIEDTGIILAKECYSMKLELLTNATVVDDAIRFVSQKSNERLKPSISEENEEESKEPDYDEDKDQLEEEQEEEAEEITINQFFLNFITS